MARTGNNTRIPSVGTYGGAPTFAADLTEVASNLADLIDPSVATVGALPASGNWYGRKLRVSANHCEYVWLGSQWTLMAGPSRTARLTTTTAQNTGATNGYVVASWSHDDSTDGLWTAGAPTGIFADRTGWWQFNANMRAGTTSYISLAVNGVVDPTRQSAADALGEMKISGLVFLTAGQALAVWITSTGAAQAVIPGNCSFDATWVHS